MKRYLFVLVILGFVPFFFSCGGGGDKPNGPITPGKVAVSSVSVSKTTADLEIGSTVQLSATVSPSNATDKSVTWSSSNANVATVTPTGMVMGKAEGTANITATAGGKSATCKVTVKKPAIPVTSVELDHTEITLKVGETQTLKATVKPDNASNKTITWNSSKADIATVDDDGKVTAVKEGIATITATSGSKSASCKVTVEKIPVSSVELDQTDITIEEGENKTLKATIKPDNATNKTVAWESSNTSIATVDNNGTVKGVAKGGAIITATCEGKTANCKITVTTPFSIELDQTEMSLRIAEIKSLKATIKPYDAPNRTVTWKSSNPNIVRVTDIGTVKGVWNGEALITATCGGKSVSCNVKVNTPVIIQGYDNGHGWVDMGLSVKWATCNVGASNMEDLGSLFAWGETFTKTEFTDYNYKFYEWYYDEKYGEERKKCIKYGDHETLELSDDAAHVNWGGDWRMPTRTEVEELIKNCTFTFYGVCGWRGWPGSPFRGCEPPIGVILTSKKNGNCIYLPLDPTSYSSVASGYPRCYYTSTSRSKDNAFCFYPDVADLDHLFGAGDTGGAFIAKGGNVVCQESAWRIGPLYIRPVRK